MNSEKGQETFIQPEKVVGSQKIKFRDKARRLPVSIGIVEPFPLESNFFFVPARGSFLTNETSVGPGRNRQLQV